GIHGTGPHPALGRVGAPCRTGATDARGPPAAVSQDLSSRADIRGRALSGVWGHTRGETRMQDDIRAEAAQYYDVSPTIPDDLAFYTACLPSPDAAVLELGCGTGRVLLPLAAACGYIYGLDRSPAMLARCRQKLQAAGLPPTRAQAELGDITHVA